MLAKELTGSGIIVEVSGLDYQIYMDAQGVIQLVCLDDEETSLEERHEVWNVIRVKLFHEFR